MIFNMWKGTIYPTLSGNVYMFSFYITYLLILFMFYVSEFCFLCSIWSIRTVLIFFFSKRTERNSKSIFEVFINSIRNQSYSSLVCNWILGYEVVYWNDDMVNIEELFTVKCKKVMNDQDVSVIHLLFLCCSFRIFTYRKQNNSFL